ncbi:MAG TPA: hypothetical protein VHR16_09930 [Candidatus Limnocylindrales bacterium]|jgi:VanZ family protein|nr:hypothetical protein [Candidatus Limnocylindrales bacterium]
MRTPSVAPEQVRKPARVHPGDVLAMLLALAPIAVLVAVASDPDVTRLVGMSALGFVIGITVAWSVLGVVAVARTRSPLGRAIALLVFTIPATVGAVVGPWLAVLAIRA